jgi:ribosome-binding protein aMBF1 (putative translation factor)
MSFGERLMQARKKKGISQEDLAKMLNTKGPVIGRYERDEMRPSIDAATNMAQLLEVSLDWLVGITNVELDSNSLKRIQDIDKLNLKDKELVFEFLDSFISNRKIKKALS